MTATPTDPNAGWLTDQHGNRNSIRFFGSREAAQTALDSLRNCENCTNCSGCSRCSDCSGCSGCSDCSGCSHVTNLHSRKDLKGDPESDWSGPPPVPQITDIHARVLAAASPDGALDMSTWHRCGTTHCRAGWVVHLAGDAGYALERFYGTALAAQLIYRESNPDLPVSPVRFWESNAQALADMQVMARREAGEAA